MDKHTCHNLKIERKFFNAVENGTKTFEIRFEDRDFKQNDFVVLHEIFELKLTGRKLDRKIGFITDYEQKLGYVVFSILPLVVQ